MKALIKTARGKGNLEIRDVSIPAIGPGEVLVRLKATGICGTDLHIEEDVFATNPPVIIGHEFSGQIAEVGPGVEGWKSGDRVVAEPHRGGCGVCRHCLTGAVEVCAKKRALGYRVDGAFTEYTNLPSSVLHRIPDNLSFEEAALCEPLAVCVKAVLQRSRVDSEDLVVVLGCGPIGLLAAAAAKAGGARRVVITGTSRDVDTRLAAAKAMGIDETIDVQSTDPVKRVKELTSGHGADLVVDATGVAPAIAQGFELLRIDGRFSGIGITGKDSVAIPWDLALKKAANVCFSYSSNWPSWERAVSLLGSGKVRVAPMLSATMALEEWKTAFDRLRRQEAIKIVLRA